jgi:hypothetical protein
MNVTLVQLVAFLYAWGIRLIVFAALLGVILGGYQYLVSAGNANAASRAKSTLISSMIGLGIALMSYTFLSAFSNQFVGSRNPYQNLNVGPIDAVTGEFIDDKPFLSLEGFADSNVCNPIGCGAKLLDDGSYHCILNCEEVRNLNNPQRVSDVGYPDGTQNTGQECLGGASGGLVTGSTNNLRCKAGLYCVRFQVTNRSGSGDPVNHVEKCQANSACRGLAQACGTNKISCCVDGVGGLRCEQGRCTDRDRE